MLWVPRSSTSGKGGPWSNDAQNFPWCAQKLQGHLYSPESGKKIPELGFSKRLESEAKVSWNLDLHNEFEELWRGRLFFRRTSSCKGCQEVALEEDSWTTDKWTSGNISLGQTFLLLLLSMGKREHYFLTTNNFVATCLVKIVFKLTIKMNCPGKQWKTKKCTQLCQIMEKSIYTHLSPRNNGTDRPRKYIH